ncbi:MAG: putative ABC exporter domain-containing protein [Thermoanaerobaculia bacterium]
MIATFCLVALQTMRNRIWQRVRRLRDPRYLIGAIAGVAYFWFVVFRRSGGIRRHPNLAAINELSAAGVSIVVLGVLLAAWALPRDAGGLDFSEAEIAFLFSAPLRRRDLLLYKIIRAQPQALMSAIIFSIISWVHARFIGVWLVFSVLSIYFTAVALARARLKLAGIGFIARILLVAAAFAGLATYARSLVAASTTAVHSPQDFFRAVSSMVSGPVASVVLFVPRLFVGATMNADLGSAMLSWVGLIVLGVALYFLAAGLNVSFEEASIAGALRRARKVEKQKRDLHGIRPVEFRTRALFKLQEKGVAEVAILWKNFIALTRTNVGFLVVIVLLYAAILGMVAWMHDSIATQAMGGMMLGTAVMILFGGPLAFANDFRLDLARAEVLKSYPLSGARLVAAEIAAPLAVISFFEVAFLATGSLLWRVATPAKAAARFVATPEFVIAAVLFAVPICAIQLMLRNALPLYFPAWAMQSRDDARGIVTAGQRIIMLAGNVLALSVLLLPPALVFLPMLWVAHHFLPGNPVGLAVATMPAIGVMAVEIWLGIQALGQRFEDFDVWNEFDVAV